MNLLSSDALRHLRRVVDEIASGGDGVRVATFRSARPNLFAAGADMAEMAAFTAVDAMEFSRLGQETFAAIERLPLLTVAIVDGDCFGGALDLILAFDIRIATPRSRFSHPGAKLGIVTGFGGTARWRHLLEPAAARALFLGNEVFAAEQAGAAGIVDLVSAETDVSRFERLDPATVRFVKELSIHSEGKSRSEIGRVGELLAAIYGVP